MTLSEIIKAYRAPAIAMAIIAGIAVGASEYCISRAKQNDAVRMQIYEQAPLVQEFVDEEKIIDKYALTHNPEFLGQISKYDSLSKNLHNPRIPFRDIAITIESIGLNLFVLFGYDIYKIHKKRKLPVVDIKHMKNIISQARELIGGK